MRWLITKQKDAGTALACRAEDVRFDRIIYLDVGIPPLEAADIAQSDVIVVALEHETEADGIRAYLQQQSIDENQIIDFYRVYRLMIPSMTADRVMMNPYIESFEGLILGLSHAEVGIIGENLVPPAANLAVSSQDLFYNYAVFQYIVEKYRKKLENLRYLVIDMYKYNYFNYDTSRSRMMPLYLYSGGYDRAAHHFSENKNFQISYDDLLLWWLQNRMKGATEQEIGTWAQLFRFDPDRADERTFCTYRNLESRGQVVTDEALDEYDYAPVNTKKHFPETIEENRILFEQLLGVVRDFCPEIRIFVIQMPMPVEAWERAKEHYLPWKAEFEEIIYAAKKKTDFTYIDMTEHPIAKERKYWFDAEHLNYAGAVRFTAILNDMISQEGV